MTVSGYGISRCGLCKFYRHEGRRDGRCSQLNAPVSSNWKVCGLAVSPFQVSDNSPVGIAKGSPAKSGVTTISPGKTAEVPPLWQPRVLSEIRGSLF